MPRADCPKTVAPGPYMPSTFAGQALTLTASDTVNFNSFKVSAAPCLLVVFGGSAGGTYTIQSAADPMGRTGDFTTLAIAANAIHVYAFPQAGLQGWVQTDGTIWIKGSVATVTFGVVQYPG